MPSRAPPTASGDVAEGATASARAPQWSSCLTLPNKTVWPSGLRRWLKAPFRKGVGSNPTAVILLGGLASTAPLAFALRSHRLETATAKCGALRQPPQSSRREETTSRRLESAGVGRKAPEAGKPQTPRGAPREHVSTFHFHQLGPRKSGPLARSRSNFWASREKHMLRGTLKLWKQEDNFEGAEASRRKFAGPLGCVVGW